jgi:hypothetical protein
MSLPRSAEPPLRPVDYASDATRQRTRSRGGTLFLTAAWTIVAALALLGLAAFVGWIWMGGWSGHI